MFLLLPFRNRIQPDGQLREPDSHQPQLQLQLHALAGHGPIGAQAAARPEPTPTKRRHGQHDAGVLQEGRVCAAKCLHLLPTSPSLAVSLSTHTSSHASDTQSLNPRQHTHTDINKKIHSLGGIFAHLVF